MSLLKNFFKYQLLILIFLLYLTGLKAQQTNEWIELHLSDALTYTEFTVNEIINTNYPASNLFDTKINTCWVSGAEENIRPAALFVKLPELDETTVNIFSGYGKSKSLYVANSRPKTIKLTLYAGLNPDGYVSESGVLYKAIKTPFEKVFELKDTFAIQSFKLNLNDNELTDFLKNSVTNYHSKYKMPVADTTFILGLEITDTYKGNRYNDICLSELFFNDCLVSLTHQKGFIHDVFISDQENALVATDLENNQKVIYKDTTSVLQLLEVSDNKKWAICVAMPTEIGGRAETTYLLIDLNNQEIVNNKLKNITGNYLWGSTIYLNPIEDRLFLEYTTMDSQFQLIELR